MKSNFDEPHGTLLLLSCYTFVMNYNRQITYKWIICYDLLNEEFKTTDELQTALYSVVKDGVLVDKELKQTQKRYFQILYNMLLGKDQGPKLGLFLMAIDKGKIKSLL